MITKRQFTEFKHHCQRGDHELEFISGKMAVLADGSVTLRLDGNMFLFTAVLERSPRPETDFLPLTVDFRENYAAAGKIGGGRFRKREGRPSDEAVLYARLTDRTLRPLFPKGMINDIVVSLLPLALDGEQDLGVMSIIGSSLAVLMAGVPFDGPVGAARVCYLDGKYIINPTIEEIKQGQMNLLVSGPADKINMIECDAKEVSNDILEKARDIAIQEVNKTIQRQKEFLAKTEPKDLSDKVVYNKPSDALILRVKSILTDDKLAVLRRHSKEDFGELFHQLENEVLEAAKVHIEDDSNDEYSVSKVKMAVFQVLKKHIRHKTIHEGVRLDGRSPMDIRPLYCEVDVLPSVHGSGLFWRGDTQVLSTVTLGSPSDAQMVDTMELDDKLDHYMHHYNFAPYSTNEARGTRGPGRREIGHGKLAEKALEYLIPDRSEFPYTIRVVSECLGSGGSTSMGSVCGSTLALMASGVPIKRPVSGIAMGLMSESSDGGKTIANYQVLNDIMGTEDFTGDMDFKVAGTDVGITAIQLDTKLHGIPVSIVKEVMVRANGGRKEILDFMLQTIDKPRSELSPHAPKIHVMKINPDKIKEIIGKGGETINKIIEQCGGIKIDIEDDGTIFITDHNAESVNKAIKMIEDLTVEFEKGKIYNASITRIEAYGVFIAFSNGKTGLVHISNLGQGVTGDLTQRFKIGEALKVSLLAIDEKGKMSFKREIGNA